MQSATWPSPHRQPFAIVDLLHNYLAFKRFGVIHVVTAVITAEGD